MGYSPLPATMRCQPLCQQLWEQRDWDLHLLLQLQTLFQKCRIFIFRRRKCLCRLRYSTAAWQIPFQSSFSAKRYPDGGFAGGRWVSIRMLPSSYFSSRLQIASRCWYFSLVAIPPRIWRSDLFRSRTTRVWAARDGLIEISLSVQSLCTVLLLIPNRFAVWRTVAL